MEQKAAIGELEFAQEFLCRVVDDDSAVYPQNLIRKKQEAEFKQRHNMSEEEFDALREKAQNRKVTLDDVYYLINKDQSEKNVAESTRKDMLTQMKNVRNMPVSQSNMNSQAPPANPDDKVFEALLGNDSDIDNLFG